MVCRVSLDTDNTHCRLLTIQHPCNCKIVNKRFQVEDEENSIEQVDLMHSFFYVTLAKG